MTKVKPNAPVPATAEERLAEVAEILAAGMLRLAAKESGSSRRNPLELPDKTRLSVPASRESQKGR